MHAREKTSHRKQPSSGSNGFADTKNQAAFVEQIARNDQERLTLQRTGDERQLRIEEWMRKSDERFDRIEKRLARIEADLLQLPKTLLQTILDQLPKAIKKEIGFKSPVWGSPC